MTPGILQKNAILGKYTILFFIKKGKTAETYRVKDMDGKLYFLKLFNVAQIHYSSFDKNGNLLEIELLKNIKHPNIAGETLAERMLREPILTIYDIRQISNCWLMKLPGLL